MYKISVIIPVYNVEHFLRRCLDSVCNQTLTDIEIICINDGSTDNSANILQEYQVKDSRIVIINQENAGISITRNKGIDIANGEYISFIDSDDYIPANFYEELYNCAKKYNSDIAATNIELCNNDGSKKAIIKYKKEQYEIKPEKKYKLAHIPTSNYVWNKIYDRVKLQKMKLKFEENILFEDILFSHKVVFYMKSISATPKTAYYYQNNKYSIVNVDSEKSFTHLYAECKKALDFIQKNNISIKNYDRHFNYKWDKKTSYNILNIPVLTIKHYGSFKYFYLFSFIPVFQIEKINRESSVYSLNPELNVKENERDVTT